MDFLKAWTGQSTDELIELEGKFRIDSLVSAFEHGIQFKAEANGEAELTQHERVVLDIEALQRDVNNGGYDQFFLNCPENVPGIVGALKRIGAEEVAVLTQEAIAKLGLTGEITRGSVEEATSEEDDARDEALSEIDSRYYAMGVDLSDQLFEFIKNNRESIVLIPLRR